MKYTTVGVDIAKNVFQLHWVDANSGEIVSKQLKRAVFLEHFANRELCLIGMEACGGAQHWARRLIEMGHQVKLMPAKFVKAFVMGNKNDPADARAIWMATQMPGKAVAVKTEGQQAVLALHRLRQQKIKFRTAQMNCLRGLLTEYGEVMAKSRAALDKAIPGVLAKLAERLPAMLIESLRELWSDLERLDKQIADIERRLQTWMKDDNACKAIAAIPGVGLLTATATVATMGDAKAFRSGREFAAWLGLVPKQVGTGGKVQLLGISRRGDTYVRTLLIHGARSVLFHAKHAGTWAEEMQKRRPSNVVTVALANKMARTIWAVLAHDKAYRSDHVSIRAA
ncbi:IS110 family transposase [Caballeronia sp. LZ032]|uniref:IS110 family transposase n=1 Tax=Caballeronia sp. LZ032 TaxID=3038565 RepID=UPI00285F934F|nr:IS110 family transposase [Caballeronia sp. LZ032]MDR5880504.1 IS110 family transposase [Caballeronia sp. LZ032]